MKKYLFLLLALLSGLAGAQTNTFPAEGTSNTFTNTNQFQLGAQLGPQNFASLPSSPDGTVLWCPDCQATNPCAGSGAGAFAQREGGAWVCTSSGTSTGGLTLTLTNSPNCTTTNLLVDLDKSNLDANGQATAQTAALSSSHVVGVAISGAGCSGLVQIATLQRATTICDNTMNIGDWVAASSSVKGECTDYGSTKNSAFATIGQVIEPSTGGGNTGGILIGTSDQLGGSNNNGNVLPAGQFKIGYYNQPGSQPTIAGDGGGTTDGNGHVVVNSLTTNGAGVGEITMGNGSVPSPPVAGNSTISTITNSGLFNCINSSSANCLPGAFLDVRAYGVDCSGSADSTPAIQAMINGTPDFSKYYFPAGCQAKVVTSSGSPKAITIQGRYGLEFWFDGHNSNSCDNGASGNGSARIIDNSSYAAGATVFYINQSQRLLFHNMVITSTGAVDTFIDVDQTTSPPITTMNTWENTCLLNNTSTKNTNFNGFRFSHTANSNVEMQFIEGITNITCSTTAPTSGTSNGNAIAFGGNINQKVEFITGLNTSNCSQDVNLGYSDILTFQHLLASNTWTNVTDGGINTLLEGSRFENSLGSPTQVSITYPQGFRLYTHDDFAINSPHTINCNITVSTGGCGNLGLFFDGADNNNDWFNVSLGFPYQGNNSSLFAVGNRNLTLSNSWEFGNGTFLIPGIPGGFIAAPSGQPCGIVQSCTTYFSTILNTYGEYLAPALESSGSPQNNPSAPLVLEELSGTAPQYDALAIQNMPNGFSGAVTDSTLEMVQLAPSSGIRHWLAFNGPMSGLTLTPIPANYSTISSIRTVGTAGSTNYCYSISAHGNVGTVVALTSPDCIATGNATLSSTNYIAFDIAAVPGATSYDVYRTTCAGVGVCSGGGATGIIGSIPSACVQSLLTCSGSGLLFFDEGQAGDGTSVPGTNTTGYVLGTELSTPSAAPSAGTELGYFKAGSGWCAYDSTGTERCPGGGGGGIGYNGVNLQTGTYVGVAGDNGKLIIMNCSSSCTFTVYGTPTSTYTFTLLSIGSSTPTVSLNSLNLNGAASVPVLNKFEPLTFRSDGTNYFARPPLAAGNNTTIATASNSISVNSTVQTKAYFQTAVGSTGTTLISTANDTYLTSFVPTSTFSAGHVAIVVTTPDNSADLYDFGIYDISGNLLCHTGPLAGSTFATSNGFKNLAFTSSCTLVAGVRYNAAATGNATTLGVAAIASGGDANFAYGHSQVTTATGGTLGTPITPPAESYNGGVQINYTFYN